MIVYKATNRINNKVYVGQYNGELVERRWAQHVREADRGGARYLCRAIRKYGAENFMVEVLHHANSKKELDAMETFFIILHQSHTSENGYNLTLGGEGSVGWIPKKETRELWSKQRTGKPVSEQQLINLSIGWKRDRAQIGAITKKVWQRPERRAKLQARTKASFDQALNEYLQNPVNCAVCNAVIMPLPHQKDKKFVSRLHNRKHCSTVCSNRARVGEKHKMTLEWRQAISLGKHARFAKAGV